MAGVNDNLIPPKKGEVRNPKGYPKGVPNTKTRLKRLLTITQNLTNPITGEKEGFTVAEQMDLAMIMKAKEGDVQAYKTLQDRLEGTPQQQLDITTLGKELPTPILGGNSVRSNNSDSQDNESIEEG